METESLEKNIRIGLTDARLPGILSIPENAAGLVLFSHGSGSSHKSPRNQFVAKHLRESGVATLLFDLLTEDEDLDYESRFDIDLLTRRLEEVTLWAMRNADTRDFGIGYLGASTGAASSLRVASELGNDIKAVVSRGGRPDLAGSALRYVAAPTLLIVGGLDKGILELNREAYEKLTCPKRLAIVPRATHLFDEEGTLEEVARLAAGWFLKFF